MTKAQAHSVEALQVQQSSMVDSYRSTLNALLMGFCEACVIALSLFTGGLIRFVIKGDPMFASWMVYLVAAWILGSLFMKLIPGWGLGPVEELRRTTLLLAGVFAATTAMLFWGKAAEVTSRLTLTLGFLVCVILVPVVRLRVKRFLIRKDLWGALTVIYTDRETGPGIIESLEREPGLGYIPVGVVLVDDESNTEDDFCGLPLLSRKNQGGVVAQAAIIALSSISNEVHRNTIETCLSKYRRVVIIPDIEEVPSLWVKPRDMVGMLGLEISSNLIDPLARFVKRTFDLSFALISLPLWLPLGLILAMIIWLEDRANPFFLQERKGLKGKTFKTWKFRTMHPRAEEILQRKLGDDPELAAEWAAHFKLKKDPRITATGRFLRRTSLDEIPQIINVLRGEMSWVGPRPLPAYHHDELPERVRELRERARPGLTGLWQVSGRSESGHAGMPKWDTYYIRNWSIWLDIVICVRTFRAVLSGHGAY